MGKYEVAKGQPYCEVDFLKIFGKSRKFTKIIQNLIYVWKNDQWMYDSYALTQSSINSIAR